MLRVYITALPETAFDGADNMLSEYRRAKIHGKNASSHLAAGLLLDYALRPFGLREGCMEYSENDFGKPFFKNRPDICFNLSHSGKYAVCAVSDRAVGIDAETCDDIGSALEIAKRYFTSAEYESIKKSGDTKSAFLNIWTRKESLLKALGTGISGGLSSYEVLADEITVGDTKYFFSGADGYKDAVITVCSPERRFTAEFVTSDMFKSL